MYPGKYAKQHPDRPAVIMAQSGEGLTYAALEARANQLSHLLRSQSLAACDHYSIFMENNLEYMDCLLYTSPSPRDS